jgi:hypothetical protein
MACCWSLRDSFNCYFTSGEFEEVLQRCRIGVLQVLLEEIDKSVIATFEDNDLLQVLMRDFFLPDGEDGHLIRTDPFLQKLQDYYNKFNIDFEH